MLCAGGIYEIFNKNGKVYIGSAVDFSGRFASHKSLLKCGKHTSIHLQRAWDKYSKKEFRFKILEKVVKKEDLVKREQYWLDNFKSYIGKNGYNICKVAGSSLGCKASKKTKKLLSKAKRGTKASSRAKQNMSISRRKSWGRSSYRTRSRKLKKFRQYIRSR